MSGVRAAYLCAEPELLGPLRLITPPWAVSLLGQLAAVRALEDADYSWVTEQLLDVARRHARGRVVASLEGGYDLAALAASAAAHLRVLISI